MAASFELSIIIPHRNIPVLLTRCLESIPVKDDIQVIIVDDNSSPEVVDFESFPGKNRHNTSVFFTKVGKGGGYARNIGLKHALGRWLIFADSDDYFNDGFLNTVQYYFNSDADVVYFSATSTNSHTLEPWTRHLGLTKTISNYNPMDIKSVNDIKYKNWAPWSKMFRHSYIKRENIVFDEVTVGNDLGFVLKAGHYSKKIEVDQTPIYCVTYRDDSLTFEDNEKAFDNRYRAVLLTNNYMMKFNKDYMVPILPHIKAAKRYGILKVIKMLFITLTYKDLFLYRLNVIVKRRLRPNQ